MPVTLFTYFIINKKNIMDEIKNQLDTVLTALDVVNEKLAEYDAKFAALESNVNNSLASVTRKPAKKEPLKNPGVIKIGADKYRFKNLSFRIGAPGTGALTVYTADAVAKDKALLEHVLAKYPSTLIKVK